MTDTDNAKDQPQGPDSSKRWLDMLEEAERDQSEYHTLCDRVDDLYANMKALAEGRKDREFQIFWANLEVLRPTVYSRPPVPVVTSRFRDRKPLPRRAADVVERALVSDVEADDLHETMLLARDDVVVNSRGVIWLDMVDRDGMDVPSASQVDRKDFRHGAARKWSEVPWVARRAWLTLARYKKRFKDKPLPQFQKRKLGGEKDSGPKKAEVWTIWDKDEGVVVWVAPGVDVILDKQPPLHDLTGFFPCPKPAFGTVKRGTLIPVPDMVYYKDQIEEINAVTARIAALTDGLRLRGIYAAGNPELGVAIEQAFQMLDDRAMLIGVPTLAALGPNANIAQAIMWLPIKEIAEVINQLTVQRRELISDVYQITGLSDIMRGSTEAAETATAQQLKAQYGSVRVRERQSELVRLARDVIRLKAEMLCEDVPIEHVLTMAQVDDLPTQADIQQQLAPLQQQAQQIARQAQQAMEQAMAAGDDAAGQQAQQQAQEAMGQLEQQAQELQGQITVEAIGELLRDQRLRPFVLDIETDSTIEPDQIAEKTARAEFMGAMGPMLQQAMGAMQMAGAAAPQMGRFVAESIRFVASGFKVQRSMDDAIDELAEGFANYQPPQEPQPAGEDPEAAQAKAQAEVMKAQAAGQLAGAKAQEAEAKVGLMQQEMQIKQAEAATRERETAAKIELIGAQVEKVAAEVGLAQQKAALDAQQSLAEDARAERAFERDGASAEAEGARADRQLDMAQKRNEAEIKARSQKPAAPK